MIHGTEVCARIIGLSRFEISRVNLVNLWMNLAGTQTFARNTHEPRKIANSDYRQSTVIWFSKIITLSSPRPLILLNQISRFRDNYDLLIISKSIYCKFHSKIKLISERQNCLYNYFLYSKKLIFMKQHMFNKENNTKQRIKKQHKQTNTDMPSWIGIF